MPGPTERVVIDPDGLRTLITTLTELRDTLWEEARLLTAEFGALDLPSGCPGRLRSAGDWADGELAMLRRRVALAEAADVGGTGAGREQPGAIVHRGRPDIFGTSREAASAGRAAADRLLRPDPDDQDPGRVGDILTILGAQIADPDFVIGFYDRLGAARLADLLYRVAGLRSGLLPRASAARGGGLDGGGPGRQHAERILGRTLALYSHLRTLDDRWLGRFNSRGRDDTAETALFGLLLPHGRFAADLLARLGELRFGTDGGRPQGQPAEAVRVRDVDLLAARSRSSADSGSVDASALGAGYPSALLHAIADDPTLAPRFASRHISQFLLLSQVGGLGLPGGVGAVAAGSGGRLGSEADRAALIAAAGGQAARRAEPAASADYVARLAWTVVQASPAPMSPYMQAAFGEVLHTWRDDLYGAVVTPLPPTVALSSAPSSTADPNNPGGQANPTNPTRPEDIYADRSAPGLGVPVKQWAALLRESLRGGVSAPMLAADAVAFGERVADEAWSRTRGYNADGTSHYPSSPRALAHLQAAAASAFFADAITGTADTLLRDHARALAEHRRRASLVIGLLAEVVSSLGLAHPAQILTRMAVGVSVHIIETKAREATRDIPTEKPRAILDGLRSGLRGIPGWQASYRSSAHDVWARRADDPLRPVHVKAADGQDRTYTGDPHADGFITGPAADFLNAAGLPKDPASMTAPQRAAYLGWLASPAIVANNDRLTILAATATGTPDDVIEGWAPDWTRRTDRDRGD